MTLDSSMRVLLVHPEDSLRAGSWSTEAWDLVIDLGKSTPSMASAWSELARCPVLRLEEYRRPIEDLRATGEILRKANGVVLDSKGIDWWELTSLFVHPEVETAILLLRLAAAVRLPAKFRVTRPCWQADAIAQLTNSHAEPFQSGKTSSRFRRYAGLVRTFSPTQIRDIALDKYDAGFRYRAAVTRRHLPGRESTVLVPSGYTNVSRTAASYARLLPGQRFLFVVTRRSGLAFDPTPNITTARLAAFASRRGYRLEQELLLSRWASLLPQLRDIPELELLRSQGKLSSFPGWFRDGVQVREAWSRVLDQEAIVAVLCGDDTNWFTRLPVVLARMRSIPTIDFHHGAFDGRFLLKTLPSEVYLAKTDAEYDYLVRVCRLPADRIVMGAPPTEDASNVVQKRSGPAGKIVYFSEPYESQGGRADEVYRELLPALCKLAQVNGTRVVVKLHPFESRPDRETLIAGVVGQPQIELIEIVQGPLTGKLLKDTWFAVTVESSTVADCNEASVPCFLCVWLRITPTGYAEQFARFGIGRALASAAEIPQIPRILNEAAPETSRSNLVPLTPERFRELLKGGGNCTNVKRIAIP